MTAISSVSHGPNSRLLAPRSKHGTRATGIVALSWLIGPSYIVHPMIIAKAKQERHSATVSSS